MPLGAYLFTDLERQTADQRALQSQIWETLAQRLGQVRLFNNPDRVLGRRALLERLHDAGINDFRVFGVDRLPSNLRFPVFVRRGNNHDGAMSPLIETWDELEEYLTRTLMAGQPRSDLLVAEFQNTSDSNGVFRKYSMFRVGDRYIPRHLIQSRAWMVKYPDIVNSKTLAEEREFLETNPHAEAVHQVFETASIDYGRIDYAILGGRIQVWEINTNPIITLSPGEYEPRHLPHQEWFAERMLAALEAIDVPSGDCRVGIDLRLAGLRSS